MILSKIVTIPSKMEKFYGKGTMLHPSIETITALVKTIPRGSIATIDTLSKRLANDFDTNVACPMRTGNALKKIAEHYSIDTIDYKVPFWRVIRTNKLVIKSKNYEFSASLLEDEGFRLLYPKSGVIRVDVDTNRLFSF